MEQFQAEDDCLRKAKTEARREFFMNASADEIAQSLVEIENLYWGNANAPTDDIHSPFGWFHPSSTVRVIVKNDDYYLNARANHFVLLFGYSEALDVWDDCVVCIANHKGWMTVTTYKFRD